MAITATRVVGPTVPGAERYTVTDIALDSSYLSGGEPVTYADLGLTNVTSSIASIQTTATTTVNATSAGYDHATQLLHVFDETPAEVASTSNLAGLVVRVLAFGS